MTQLPWPQTPTGKKIPVSQVARGPYQSDWCWVRLAIVPTPVEHVRRRAGVAPSARGSICAWPWERDVSSSYGGMKPCTMCQYRYQQT
jgi:hypothetical protein